MKSTLLLCVLAVLAVGSKSSVARAPVGRTNLNLGNVAAGDRMLLRQNLYRSAIPNAVQHQDLGYRGNSRITAIQAVEVGNTEWASAFLVSGGIGQDNAIIRVQSARGYGYYYQIDIWGR